MLDDETQQKRRALNGENDADLTNARRSSQSGGDDPADADTDATETMRNPFTYELDEEYRETIENAAEDHEDTKRGRVGETTELDRLLDGQPVPIKTLRTLLEDVAFDLRRDTINCDEMKVSDILQATDEDTTLVVFEDDADDDPEIVNLAGNTDRETTTVRLSKNQLLTITNALGHNAIEERGKERMNNFQARWDLRARLKDAGGISGGNQ